MTGDARCDTHRLSAEVGETLIEVLIGIAILGLVSVALVGAILTSLRGSSVDQQAARADAALRTAAAGVFSAADEKTHDGQALQWDSTTGCLSSPLPTVGAVATPLPPANGVCSGFEEVELTLPDTTAQPLYIWVRQP